jgi:hypothetical protein
MPCFFCFILKSAFLHLLGFVLQQPFVLQHVVIAGSFRLISLGALSQASLLLLCPCLLAWAVPICLDRVVVAFLVADSMTWWL